MNIIDWVLYIPLTLCVCYLLLYAIASKFYRAPQYPEARTLRHIVVLFPAYKEDRVILSSVRSFLGQDYPKELFDLVVISDQMQPETNEALRTLPIRLLMADYTESSKAKALAMAMNNIDTDLYDIVVIMDADNVTVPEFLSCINRAFDSGVRSIQAHRTGKNLNTDISILDGASEEINNGFFRSGHNALGLSAGLSGSGMAFDAKWFQQNVQYLQTAGEDKELESMLLQQRIHTVYLNDLPVFDEKTQKKEAISNQRKRWIAAQFGALRASLPHLPKALLQGNIDYCDKIFQWMLPPRLIQLAGVFGLTFVFTVIGLVMSLRNGGNEWTMAIKWWILSVAQVSAMILPVPGGQLLTKEVGKAIMKIPMLAVTMIGNLFKLKGANKKFIHTEHGEHHSHS
jgi:cellulose synthase/poly-beta-1,6-N-acetylglucosamine synthase-like glycosyltransferase